MDRTEQEVLKRLGRVTRNLILMLHERSYVIPEVYNEISKLSEEDFVTYIYNEKIAKMNREGLKEMRARTLLTNTFFERKEFVNQFNLLEQSQMRLMAIRNEYSQHMARGYIDEMTQQKLQNMYNTEQNIISNIESFIQSNTAVVIFLDTIKSADSKEIREMTDTFIVSEIENRLKSAGENPARTTYTHFILISELPYSTSARKIIHEEKLASLRVELWTDEELGYIPIDHELTPKHVLLKKGSDGYKQIVKKFNRKKTMVGEDGAKKVYTTLGLMPRLKTSDIIVRFIGGEEGDLVEIRVDNSLLPTLHSYGFTYARIIKD